MANSRQTWRLTQSHPLWLTVRALALGSLRRTAATVSLDGAVASGGFLQAADAVETPTTELTGHDRRFDRDRYPSV